MKKILFFLTFLFVVSAYADDNLQVNGVITDINNKPIAGITIGAKANPRNKVVTNTQGKFSITVPKNSSIEVYHEDYHTKTIYITNQTQLNLRMTKYLDVHAKKKEALSITSFEEYAVTNIPSLVSSKAKSKPNTTKKRSSTTKPNNTSNESYATVNENKFLNVDHKPVSTFSIDVDRAAYSNIRRYLNNGSTPPKDAVRIEEMINYFNYDHPTPRGEHPFGLNTEISKCPWNNNNRLLLVNLTGKKINNDQKLPPSNLVFLIDVSGSMGDSDKLPLLKKSFGILVEKLRPQDKVSIVVYAGAAGMVLPPTSGDQKSKIMASLNNLSSGGSTAGGAGIHLAYKLADDNYMKNGNNRVILATDGDFNVGASSDQAMIRLVENKRRTGIYITTLGFGTGNYKDSKMEQIADHGNGNYAYIDTFEEANKVFTDEFSGTLHTIAKDVKLQLEFNPRKVGSYRLIGYANRMLAKKDFDDDTKDAGELGYGHTVTALYEIVPIASNNTTRENNTTNELVNIKMRYKKPAQMKSILMTQPVMDQNKSLDKTSNNFRWASAVAEFGMLLRNSKHKGTANYAQLFDLARGAKGQDKKGYRAECIRLMEKASNYNNKFRK